MSEERQLLDDTNQTIWEKPAFQRIGADEAESGLLLGPEVIILLS